jgi:hypothetical protein
MALWRRLYNTVWLAFFCCVFLPRWMGAFPGFPIHSLLGVVLLLAAQANSSKLQALGVPERLKRISKVIAAFSLFQLVLGAALGVLAHFAPTMVIVSTIVKSMHVVIALAMLAQSASVATGYDMWEEKEF